MSDKFTTYGPSGMPCMCVPFLSGTPLPVLLFRSDSDCAPLLQRIADAGFIVVVSADLAAALAYVKREVMIADFTVDQGKIAAGAFGAAVGELVSFAVAHAAEIKAVAFVAPASNDAEAGETAVLGLPSLWVTAEDDVPGATIASRFSAPHLSGRTRRCDRMKWPNRYCLARQRRTWHTPGRYDRMKWTR